MPVDAPGSRAARFARLHEALFLMPNAWDAASAALFARIAPAIGTSSAAAAATRGLRDGERIGRAQALAAAAKIIEAAGPTPVNIDLEAGFGDTPEAVADVVADAIGMGAAGINLEDTDPATGRLRDAGLQAEIVAACTEALSRHDPDVVLNARTDVFWNGVGEPRERPALARQRLEAYRRAAATCLFVPGFTASGEDATALEDVVGGWAPSRSTCSPPPVWAPTWTSSPPPGCAGSASAPRSTARPSRTRSGSWARSRSPAPGPRWPPPTTCPTGAWPRSSPGRRTRRDGSDGSSPCRTFPGRS